MMSLARGLAVLTCFAEARRPLSIAEASALTGIGRSAVRRCLHTLKCLGYAVQNDRLFALRAKTLSLGHAYLESDTLAKAGVGVLMHIRDRVRKSCSLGILEGDEVRYIARSATVGIMSVAIDVGSRLPLHCTSMGRVLLADMTADAREAYFARTDMTALTPHTLTDHAALGVVLDGVAEHGHAIVDQELELGLRSIAVPVRDGGGTVVAALNIGTSSARITLTEMRERLLPALLRGAAELRSAIA